MSRIQRNAASVMRVVLLFCKHRKVRPMNYSVWVTYFCTLYFSRYDILTPARSVYKIILYDSPYPYILTLTPYDTYDRIHRFNLRIVNTLTGNDAESR